MCRANRLFTVQTFLLLSICCVGLGFGQRDKFLGGLIDYLNNLPNQPYIYEDGLLRSNHNEGDNIYRLEVSLKASDVQDPKSFKLLRCTATVQDNGDSGVTVLESQHQCHEDIVQPPAPEAGAGAGAGPVGGEEAGEEPANTDAPLQEAPVKLDNEVQSDTAVTSGEQFVAIPRHVPNLPCIGCSSHVNPAAPGVLELALLGIRHLDRHDPDVRHNLKGVLDVERQVQVVNGVRYILTLKVAYDNCTISETDAAPICFGDRTCKISILEKPWLKLPDGTKFRAILSNNCTENWLFGDDGEVLPPENRIQDKNNVNSIDNGEKHGHGSNDELIKAVYQTDTQARPATERTLSEHDLKLLEDQIIPRNEENTAEVPTLIITTELNIEQKEEHVLQNADVSVQKTNINDNNNIQFQKKDQEKKDIDGEVNTLTDQKKKDIDEFVNFLNYANLEENPAEKEHTPRMKRSFDHDLKLLNLAEMYKNIKSQVAEGETVVKLGEFLVNYMNEMDIEIKTRVLKDVLKAEEESDNYQQFVYIQARVYIPCGKMGCESNENVTNICNAIIDNTDIKSPQMLNYFCYEEKINNQSHGKVTIIPLDDPVLRNIANDVLKKMEDDSNIPNAINLLVLHANTRKTVGIVTEISVETVFTNCNKTIPFSLRDNCTALENVGSNICQAVIVDRSWLNVKQISYTCMKRSVDESFSTETSKKSSRNTKNPKIFAMAQLALRHLEERSNVEYRQKIVDVTKVSTQLVAGLLTNLEFVVGYTTCLHSDSQLHPEDCKLYNDLPLRNCKAQIWDRSWLIDDKQVKVTCDNSIKEINALNNNEISRKKRELGVVTEQDSKEEEYKILANDALKKYLEQSGGLSAVVTKVLRVTTEVEEGFTTKIEFEALRDDSFKLICHASVLEQPWLDKKDLQVVCSQSRRLAGPFPGNVSDPRYLKMAAKSLKFYYGEIPGMQVGKWNITNITLVLNTLDPVKWLSGTLTQVYFTTNNTGDAKIGLILSCVAKIWQMPWLKREDVLEIDCWLDARRKLDEKSDLVGFKSQIGGLNEQDPTNPKFFNLAKEALEKYVGQSGSIGEVSKILHVATQVVTGIRTIIYFQVIQNGSKNVFCKTKVLEQPWLNNKDIDIKCFNKKEKTRKTSREKLLVVGGKKEQYPKDPKYQILAEKSLQKHVSQKGLAGVWKVSEVTKVTSQVVAGSLTEVYFNVVENGGQIFSCHSKVWEQPWLNKEEITVECDDAGREKRGITGGINEKDPKDPKYQVLAEKSLQKHVSQKGLAGVWKVSEVTKVTSQVVAGSLTEVYFNVVENGGQIFSCHSKVWEQPWLNKEEITVECDEGGRQKRQIPGGINEQDPKNPKYQVLAEKSLQKHVSQKGLAGVWKVSEVTKVTSQVVAGSLTEVYFNVVENGGQIFSCHSKVWEQPWLNKEEITVECDDAGREKRGITGGINEKDPKDPKYQVLAEKSLQKHVSQKGLAGVWKVSEVTKVTSQVVAGSLTEVYFNVVENGGQIFSCHSKVWEQPWLNKEEITVECDDAGREKRGITGGINEKDPKDPKYQVLAEKSLQKHVSQKGLAGVWKVSEVTKVTSQVVAGSLTEVYFNVVENGGQIFSCHSKVWEQPWLNKEEITVECDEGGRQKRQIPGSINEQDPKNPKYQVLAEKSLQKHVSQKGLAGVWKVAEVNKVTYQVVAGSLTDVYFSVVENGGQLLSCHSKVWERPWLKEEDITVECDEGGRQKRKISGGINEKDPKDPKYQVLAEKSLQKHVSQKGLAGVWKVSEVTKVTSQVVAGSLTEVYFNVVENGGQLLSCHSKVWERPWLKEEDITVECDEGGRRKREIPSGKLKQDPKYSEYQITSDARSKRQIRPDDYDIDDNVKFLYAEKAIDDLNLRSDTQNMQKLVAIHSTATSMQMGTQLVRMYIEVGYTFCLKQHKPTDMSYCDELDGLNHRLCLVKVYPTAQDDNVIKHISTVCDDESDFEASSGLNVLQLIKASIKFIEQNENLHNKLVHQGEPNMVPSLDTSEPIKLSFIVATTNCSENDVSDIYDYARLQQSLKQKDCIVLESIHPKACSSFIWMFEKSIKHIKAVCRAVEPATRFKRSTDGAKDKNSTGASVEELVNESIHKLEMSNIYKFKQRVLQINSYNTKITTGKLTTVDFDVGYTSCLKYEWVDDMSKCEFLEHLPRRHCVSLIYERLWVANGRDIRVTCQDDDIPLEAHTEFENPQLAASLGAEALKHIEFKYPHPQRQTVVRIFSVEKQTIAGLHYRLKLEVGFTDCLALSVSTDCNLAKDKGDNRFCRANIWLRPWTDQPPTVRVVCDYQEAATTELYHRVQVEHLFYDFVATHRPAYYDDPIEMGQRFQIFSANVRKIHELNTREKGTARYAVTQFADLSYEEFFRQYLGLKPGLSSANEVPRAPAQIPRGAVPASFDWRERGAVTPVKNQGSCGSCWAFSVTGNIEGQYKLQTGKLVSLSEQELVDCDTLDQGCNGGMPDSAYRAIEAMGGLETEDDYPYEGANDKCSFNRTLARVRLSGAVNISSNESDMAQWLVRNGPISIGINANAMQFYVGGVSHPWKMLCSPKNIDHGVLIVGYGVKNYPLFNKVLPYWIVKNSWGPSWGEQGYYRVFRGDGTCGVNTLASSAKLAIPQDV